MNPCNSLFVDGIKSNNKSIMLFEWFGYRSVNFSTGLKDQYGLCSGFFGPFSPNFSNFRRKSFSEIGCSCLTNKTF